MKAKEGNEETRQGLNGVGWPMLALHYCTILNDTILLKDSEREPENSRLVL